MGSLARQRNDRTHGVNAWVKVGQLPVRPVLLLLHKPALANNKHEAGFHYPLPAHTGRSGMGFLSVSSFAPKYISVLPPITFSHFLLSSALCSHRHHLSFLSLGQPAVPPSNGSLDGQNGKSDGKNSTPENGGTGSEHHFDPDDIAAKVAAIERQEAAMIRELNHFASLVKETSRAVSERANVTRIEMAKLRKTVQLQQQVRTLSYHCFTYLCFVILQLCEPG
jgi:hypothetical protein